jgi:hypothetical protein
MSAPLDVLAGLDEAHDWLYRSSESRGDDDRAEAVNQARAAVAELIAAAKPFAARNSSEGVTVCISTEEVARLRAALARVGGAA